MYDVIIIGAGISGATIARELSKYNIRTLILEKENDVAMEATLANSAIVHSGHNPDPGTLKAKFNVMGNKMYKKMSDELDIPLLECGGMVVSTNETQNQILSDLRNRALANGLSPDEAKIIDRFEILKLEPNISDSVKSALFLKTTMVTFPWEVAIANIENAMNNGVELMLNTKVLSIGYSNRYNVKTGKGTFEASIVINASGVNAQEINEMVNKSSFKISPRRGEYFVLDNDITVVNSVIYPTPTDKGKGVIATPQVHGNTLLGPTSMNVDFDNMTKTSYEGLDYIKESIKETIKDIPFNKIIRSFSGSRASSDVGDFIIDENNKFINVAGIDSPGLTAAPAVAKYVVEEMVANLIQLKPKKDWNPKRRKVIRLNELSKPEREELFKSDSRYANVICRCENISEGEVIDSIKRNCGATTITGVKMRARPGAGRCQGGVCQPEVLKILSRELNIKPTEVVYKQQGTNILVSRTKE